jgi:hypothetical protein
MLVLAIVAAVVSVVVELSCLVPEQMMMKLMLMKKVLLILVLVQIVVVVAVVVDLNLAVECLIYFRLIIVEKPIVFDEIRLLSTVLNEIAVSLVRAVVADVPALNYN